MSSPFVETFGGAVPCTAEKCEPFYIREWETMIVGSLITLMLLYICVSCGQSYFDSGNSLGVNTTDSGSNRFGTRDDRAGQDNNAIFDYTKISRFSGTNLGVLSPLAGTTPNLTSLPNSTAAPNNSANPIYAVLNSRRDRGTASQGAAIVSHFGPIPGTCLNKDGKVVICPPKISNFDNGVTCTMPGTHNQVRVPDGYHVGSGGKCMRNDRVSNFYNPPESNPLDLIQESAAGRSRFNSQGPNVSNFMDFSVVDGIDSLKAGEPSPSHMPETSESVLADVAGIPYDSSYMASQGTSR